MQSVTRLLLSTSAILFYSSVYATAEDLPDAPVPPPIDAGELIHTLKESGNERAAISILRNQTKEEAASAEDFIKLAKTLQKVGSNAEAVATMQRAQAKFPEDSEVMFQLGRAYIAAGSFKDAVHTMDMLTAMEPDNAMAYNAKAVAFDKAGNHFAAQEIYEIALNIDPESVPIRNNLAMSYILDENARKAIDLLESLHEQSGGGNRKVRHNLALAYGLSGKKDKAITIAQEDLSDKEAKENLRFYEHYSSMKKRKNPVSLYSEDDQLITGSSAISEAKKPSVASPQQAVTQLETTEEKQSIQGAMPPAKTESQPQVVTRTKIIDAQDAAELSPASGGAASKTTDSAPAEKKEPFFGKDAVYQYPSRSSRR